MPQMDTCSAQHPQSLQLKAWIPFKKHACIISGVLAVHAAEQSMLMDKRTCSHVDLGTCMPARLRSSPALRKLTWPGGKMRRPSLKHAWHQCTHARYQLMNPALSQTVSPSQVYHSLTQSLIRILLAQAR